MSDLSLSSHFEAGGRSEDVQSADIYTYDNRVAIVIDNGNGDGCDLWLTPADASRLGHLISHAAKEAGL